MSECKSIGEYELKYQRNSVIAGSGRSTTLRVPCPFCAEPDFFVHSIFGAREAFSAGAVCDHCGRGCRAVYTDDGVGGFSFEFIQTVGSDPPSFIPGMRRDPEASKQS